MICPHGRVSWRAEAAEADPEGILERVLYRSSPSTWILAAASVCTILISTSSFHLCVAAVLIGPFLLIRGPAARCE